MNERQLVEELDGIRIRITAIIKEVDPKFDDAEDGLPFTDDYLAVSYTHLTLPTKPMMCRSRWSPYH